MRFVLFSSLPPQHGRRLSTIMRVKLKRHGSSLKKKDQPSMTHGDHPRSCVSEKEKKEGKGMGRRETTVLRAALQRAC
jgi:hypothetical protein